MIQAFRKGADLLAQIDATGNDSEALSVWWLGQSGFLLKSNGRALLFDPYLSDSLTKKYADTDKPHVRMTELVVQPDELTVELVTSSHNHTDHLDAESLLPLMKANEGVPVLVPAANQQFAADRLGVEANRLLTIDAGSSIQIDPFVVHAVPAAHESVERDELGRCKFLGYVVEFNGFTIYHSGDTMLYDGMVEQLRAWEIDLALLPINGRAPERRVAGNLWGRESAKLAKDIGAKLVVPCHYDMFEFNTESPDEFVHTCEELGQAFRVLKNGEHLTIQN